MGGTGGTLWGRLCILMPVVVPAPGDRGVSVWFVCGWLRGLCLWEPQVGPPHERWQRHLCLSPSQGRGGRAWGGNQCSGNRKDE